MSATPPTDPNAKDPKPPAASNTLSNALIWALLAILFAGGLIYYGTTIEGEKKNFYFIAGAVAAIIGLYNGYIAWTIFQKSKEPPTAPK